MMAWFSFILAIIVSVMTIAQLLEIGGSTQRFFQMFFVPAGALAIALQRSYHWPDWAAWIVIVAGTYLLLFMLCWPVLAVARGALRLWRRRRG